MCLDNCPQTDQAGNQLVLDVFSRQCLRIKDNPEYRPAAKYEFSRLIGKDVTWYTIYNESNVFVTKLKRYQDQSIQESRLWAEKNPDLAQKYRQSCTFRGVLVQQLSNYHEAYFECRCSPGYYGQNCVFDKDLYEAMQRHVTSLLVDMLKINTIVNMDYMFQTLMNLNQGSLGTDAFKLMIYFIERSLLTTKHIVGSYRLFLQAFDLIIRNHVRQEQEVKNSQESNKFDVQYPGIRKSIYLRLHKLVQLAQVTGVQSLNRTAMFESSDTLGFQVTHVTPNASFFGFESEQLLSILPSDILALGYNDQPISVKITATEISKGKSTGDMAVVGWLYSNLIFNRPLGSYFLTQIVSIQLINRNSLTSSDLGKVEDQDGLTIRFPIKSMPADHINPEFQCVAFKLVADKTDLEQVMVGKTKLGFYAYNRKPWVECSYKTGNFDKIFFAVKKDQSATQGDETGQIERDPMTNQTIDTGIANYIIPANSAQITGSIVLLSLATAAIQFI